MIVSIYGGFVQRELTMARPNSGKNALPMFRAQL